MRIAQVAPLFVRIPPERYGGTERVVQALTEALVERGHEVTPLPPEEPEPRPREAARGVRQGRGDGPHLPGGITLVEERLQRSIACADKQSR